MIFTVLAFTRLKSTTRVIVDCGYDTHSLLIFVVIYYAQMENQDRIIIEYRRYYHLVLRQQINESAPVNRQKSTRSATLQVAAMINICLNLIMLLILIFRTAHDEISIMSRLVLLFSFISLSFDHAVVALGAYIGESRTLKILSKLRCGFHAIAMPLLFLPISEVCTRVDLISKTTDNLTISISILLAAHEAMVWYKYDIHDLVLLDRRDSVVNTGLSFAGSLSYISGRGFKAFAPAILFNLFALYVGMYLLWNGFSGEFLFVSAMTTLVSNVLNKPFLQMLGETVLLGSILRTLMVL